MEKKKKVTVLGGKPGQNKAEITEQEQNANSEIAIHAQGLLKTAGKVLSPEGSTYLGSAVIHYYSKEVIATNPYFFCVIQLGGLSKVEEQHADLGWKQLKSAFMQAYGREESKAR